MNLGTAMRMKIFDCSKLQKVQICAEPRISKLSLQQYYSSSLNNLAVQVIKKSFRDSDLEDKTGKRSFKKSFQKADWKDNVDTEVITLIVKQQMIPRLCGKKSDAPFPAPRSSESQSCMAVSCICICLNTRKTVSTSLVPGQGKSFSNSETLLLSLPRQSSMVAKRVHIFMYIQSWMTPGAFGFKKVPELYYMFHEFWRHGLPVSGQGLNVYTKCVIPTFCIFGMSWIHKHLRSLKRRVLRTPPHLCPYIHECPK